MGPCRVFKYYKNRCCSKNSAVNPEKFWVEYSNRSIGLGQVVSLTKSGQEPIERYLSLKITFTRQKFWRITYPLCDIES
jgi:hypothetical protein